MTPDGKKIVLAAGCPRSGTTALMYLLNCHPQMAVTHERYSKRVVEPGLDAALFGVDRMRDFREGDGERAAFDTDVTQHALSKLENARVVGDKIPNVGHVVAAAEKLRDVSVIAIVREPRGVAHSHEGRRHLAKEGGEEQERLWPDSWNYKAGVDRVNGAVRVLLDLLERPEDIPFRLLVVEYSALFSGAFNADRLYEFVGLDPSLATGVEKIVNGRARDKMHVDLIDQYVAMNADFSGYRRLIEAVQARNVRSTP